MSPSTKIKQLSFRHYLKTWFILDVVSSINADIFIIIFQIEKHNVWYFKIPSFLKVFRCYTLFLYLDRIREVSYV